MDVALPFLIGAIVGYVCGMFPTGAIVGRRFGVDLRRVGSGSTGATNVLRTLGTRWAALVVTIDLLKGTVAVLVVGLMLGGAPWDQPTWPQVVASAFAVIGHTFSALIRFKGGRGIVTGGGGLLLLSPLAFVAALICGVGAIVLTRFVSLGSLIGAVVAGTIIVWQAWTGAGPWAFYLYGTLVPGFVIWSHRGNIKRLATGTERKLSRGSARR